MLWKDVYNYEGIYRIDEYGNTYSLLTNSYKTPSYDRDGYPWVMLHGKDKPVKKFIHTLVLETFVSPRPNNCVARHYPDPTPTNTHYTNLIWGSAEDNAHDRGDNPNNEIHIDRETALTVKNEILNGETQINVCKKYNLSRNAVSEIVTGKRWKNVGPDVSNINYDKRRNFNKKEISEIKYLLNRNYSTSTITYNYNITTNQLSKLQKTERFQSIPEENDISFLNSISIKQNTTHKITNHDINNIKNLKASGYSPDQIAKFYNVHYRTILRALKK